MRHVPQRIAGNPPAGRSGPREGPGNPPLGSFLASGPRTRRTGSAPDSGSVAGVGRSAAFFDLDRTVLPRSSSPEFHAALADAGLVPRRELPGAGLLGFAYDHFGESLAVMALARAAALTSRGWPVDRVDAAAEAAAARLETRVAPYLRPLLA